jgi:hypothetical protein
MELKHKIYLQFSGFIIFSMVITYLTITFSQAAKIVDYLDNNQETLEENPLAFFLATAIAHRHDGSDAFVVEQPILDQSYTSNNIQFRFRLFTLVSFKDNQFDDILVFFLDDIIVEDDLVVLADDGEVDIRSTITFNQSIGENESNMQTIPFVSGFNETTRIIFFEYTQFNRVSNPLAIERIEIVYAILDLGLVSTLVLDQNVMSSIDASAYLPSQSYSDTFLTNESIYYDAIWLTRFNAFNVYDLYYLGGIFLFLLLIGYVSFIYPRRKQKKSLNSNIVRTRKVL